MPLSNTASRYGTITKSFHWLTALLILTAIPLALIAERLPQETSDEVAVKALIFSIHKTLGVTIFFIALLRILWALTQSKPAPVHPERQAEMFLAETVHWTLYAALVVVPLSGWIGHASAEGFAPILWPFGQTLPLVPKSTAVEHAAFTTHWVFTKVLIGALLLHVAGALKHALIERDGTLSRMWFGQKGARPLPTDHHPHAAVLLAAAIYVFGAVAVLFFLHDPSEADSTTDTAATGGNWQVQDGTIALTVRQMGSAIEGGFADWSADITFDEDADAAPYGDVTVTIDIPSVTIGSVTSEALGPQYFDADNHSQAVFEATIVEGDGTQFVADGTLSLAGETSPVSLPFSLSIDGDTATMEGATTLDRRNFGIGEGQTDPATLGFEVQVDIALTAARQ